MRSIIPATWVMTPTLRPRPCSASRASTARSRVSASREPKPSSMNRVSTKDLPPLQAGQGECQRQRDQESLAPRQAARGPALVAHVAIHDVEGEIGLRTAGKPVAGAQGAQLIVGVMHEVIQVTPWAKRRNRSPPAEPMASSTRCQVANSDRAASISTARFSGAGARRLVPAQLRVEGAQALLRFPHRLREADRLALSRRHVDLRLGQQGIEIGAAGDEGRPRLRLVAADALEPFFRALRVSVEWRGERPPPRARADRRPASRQDRRRRGVRWRAQRPWRRRTLR